MNLEKRGVQNTIRVLLPESVNTDVPQIPIKCQQKITSGIKDYYTNLFKRTSSKSSDSCKQFLLNLNLPSLTQEQKYFLNKPLTLSELEFSIKNSQNGKSPGNDGLTREFYIVFWRNISDLLFQSLLHGKEKGFLSPSQRQAIIKLIEKKNKDKRFIKNWRPISLINYDAKLLSKTLAERLKRILPSIILHNQTAYVANRFIGESIRLISDLFEITQTLDIEGYLLTIDIEKAFDSVDHPFLFAVLETMGFDSVFLDWIKVLHKKQESCVMNGGVSTVFFPLNRGSRQGDPISAYMFIIVMETFFTMVRNNPNISGLDILGFNYLLTSYADDTTFFIQNIDSIYEIFYTFETFSEFSGLKVNQSKCEIAGIGVKNGAKVALLGLECVDLNQDSMRILGVHFSYNNEIFKEKNFQDVVNKIEKVLAIWRWRNLTLAGKISIFKSLAFSKIVFISYLSNVPNSIINKIEALQKEFIWNGKTPKIKHSTLISDYEEGGLKDIDVKSKIKSLNLSWIKRLYGEGFHPWKNIPLKLIEQSFCQNIFYPNMEITPPLSFPKFYKQILLSWSELSQNPITVKNILNQPIWFNRFIKIQNAPIKKMLPIELFIFNFFENGILLYWDVFKNKYDLQNKDYFKWRQIVTAIPTAWKTCIAENPLEQVTTPPLQHVLQLTKEIPLDKLTSKFLYTLFLHKIKKSPSSHVAISNEINDQNINWTTVYNSGRKTTIDSYGRMFHYKCSHKTLFLNKMLFRMNIAQNSLCSYCKTSDETIPHLFFDCHIIKNLWNELRQYLHHIPLPELSLRSAYLGYYQSHDILVNQIYLIFKIVIYNQRDSGFCNLHIIKAKINSIKEIEKNITFLNPHAKLLNSQKWARLLLT